MMQIMRSILQIYLTTVRHTQKKQRLMNFSFLDISRHAEEREFEVSGTNQLAKRRAASESTSGYLIYSKH